MIHHAYVCRWVIDILSWAVLAPQSQSQEFPDYGKGLVTEQTTPTGGDVRDAIIAETTKRNMKAFLRPAVPFGSHQLPPLITPGAGPTSIKTLH